MSNIQLDDKEITEHNQKEIDHRLTEENLLLDLIIYFNERNFNLFVETILYLYEEKGVEIAEKAISIIYNKFVLEKNIPAPQSKEADKQSVLEGLSDAINTSRDQLITCTSEKEAHREMLALLNSSIAEIVLERRRRIEELRESILPAQAPLLWVDRDKSKNQSFVDFFNDIYSEYVKLGILTKKDLEVFDKTLYNGLQKDIREGGLSKDDFFSNPISNIDDDLVILPYLIENDPKRAQQVACGLCQRFIRSNH